MTQSKIEHSGAREFESVARDRARWLHIYERMLKIRLFEEQVNELYLSAKMPGLAHLYVGEEAVAVGVCEALRRDDYITSTHRGHGHCLAKGASVDRMFAELLGKAAGYCRGKGGSMHIADPDSGNLGANAIVGGSAGIATGAARSAKMRGTDQVAVCFFGEGALGQGRKFEQFMGLPTAFHWYNWHKIPFDNDYPHYFPARDGFKETVAELQKAGGNNCVFVMPYINGRLWDTRDKGAADFQFTKLARPAATKDEDGRVYTEMYSSKEADGSRVKLAAMCPATALWRDRVRQIVLRLMKDNGTKAVYIDQIAAAGPRLCFDKSHGHPLGGGGWWVKAYGKMLAELRKAMPAGHVLTTECNAEPYLKWFDGYLTWHWQYDGQVPAFGAVYGGAIQMFGRAYRGGPTKDLALRMKAGQQLVFGEQIGWISAGVVNERANAAFLRQMAWLRWRLRRYFDAGRMARPPKLIGKIPTVTADWQWHGVWPVTTDAVLTGAWEQPARKKVVLIFVNVSDKPVTAQVPFDASSHALPGEKVRLTRITSDGPGRAESAPARFTRKILFAPEKAWAWEVTPEGD